MPQFGNESLRAIWHLPMEGVLAQFGVNAAEGVSETEARRKLKQYGHNALRAKTNSGWWRLLLAQFNTPLMYLLIFAALLSLILYDNTDAFIILGIILASALISFFQERSAVNAMEKLLSIVKIKTHVVRNGIKKAIPLEDVVPGDIVELSAGDVIPGDCYLLEARDLYVDEATLTGETFYAEKHPGKIVSDTPIAKRSNALFMGTHVVSGTAKALVVLTGKNTQFGKISERLTSQLPENEFEHGVRRFGYFLMEVTFILLIVIFALNIYFAKPFVESLLFALSLSVGLTPQLLPAIIAINLAHGAKKMAKDHVIVKKLASIENFGSMNILCADKTGTLTTGEIKLEKGCDYLGNENKKVLLYAYLNAKFQSGYTNPIDNAITNTSQEIGGWKKLDEVPYDFTRKRLSVLAQKGDACVMITKGAFQEILSVCTQVETGSGERVAIARLAEDLKHNFETYSNEGYRVLGLAYKENGKISSLAPQDEKQMIFLGFLVFCDPLKKDVQKTIHDLEKLGVELKIITGDNKLVALHVAKQLGLSEEEVITGAQLHQMSDRALFHQVGKKKIFTEIEPNQKERIILALRKAGNAVGFLGDGINDVTALHAADVSISVNSAAAAAKEVANIVLMKKDLSVLCEGVKAGRMTFANTLKYIFMASSANFGNMFSMAGASLFLPFLPLLPKQVLLTNLMTDFPEMTIATDRVDREMIEKPLRWNIDFIRKFMMVFGLISSFFDFATFGVLLWLNASVDQFRTAWFIESVVSATLIVLIIRTFKPFYTSGPSRYLLFTVLGVVIFSLFLPVIPFAHQLGFTYLESKFYLFIAIIVTLYMLCVELAKRYFFAINNQRL